MAELTLQALQSNGLNNSNVGGHPIKTRVHSFERVYNDPRNGTKPIKDTTNKCSTLNLEVTTC